MVTGASFSAQLGSFWPLAGEPSSLSENRHYELALSIVVSRIVLFQLIEHLVNFSLGGAFQKRIFAISSLKPANIGWIQMASIHLVSPFTALNINALGKMK